MFDLKLIMKYRSELMGFSMIWIILYHFGMFGLWKSISDNGFTGVDIFMFVSGLGLFFSLFKNPDIERFYKKRFFRILPTYFIIGIIYFLIINNRLLISDLFRLTTLGFWTNNEYWDWFIPSILFLYFIFPFLYNTLYSKKIHWPCLIIVNTILFILIAYYTYDYPLAELKR